MRIAARMAAQRGLGLFRAAERAAVAQLRQISLVCASACAVEALPSSQTAEQPASHTAAIQDEQLPRAVSAAGFLQTDSPNSQTLHETASESLHGEENADRTFPYELLR